MPRTFRSSLASLTLATLSLASSGLGPLFSAIRDSLCGFATSFALVREEAVETLASAAQLEVGVRCLSLCPLSVRSLLVLCDGRRRGRWRNNECFKRREGRLAVAACLDFRVRHLRCDFDWLLLHH